MDPEISIILSTYNRAKFLKSLTIPSVLNQTFTNWELIIIDDCSTDNTENEVKLFKKDCSKIVYYKFSQNVGYAETINKGVELASGNYIALLDGDDGWIKNKLENQIKFVEKEKIIGCTCFVFEYNINKKKLDGICSVGLPGFIAKKDFFKLICPLDKNLRGIEDAEFFIKLEIAKMDKKIKEDDFKLLKEPLVFYTRHSAALSFGRQNSSIFIEKYSKLLEKYSFLENRKNLTPDLKNILSNCWSKLGMHYLIINNRRMAQEAIYHSLRIKKTFLGKFLKYIDFLPPKFYFYCRILFREIFIENIYFKYNLIKFRKYYLNYKKDLNLLIKSVKNI